MSAQILPIAQIGQHEQCENKELPYIYILCNIRDTSAQYICVASMISKYAIIVNERRQYASLRHVLHALAHYGADVVVGEGVEHTAPRAAAFDEFILL